MTATVYRYIQPADKDLLPLTGAELRELAAGRGKKAEAAQAEIDRRKQNRAARRGQA